MTLEEKVAQMFLVGIRNKKEVALVESLIKQYGIGGVIIYRNNYNDYKEMIDLVNELKNSNKNNKYPLFIAIDQEGGRVNRMPDNIHNVISAYQLGLLDDETVVNKAGKVTATMLRESGINMDFAPVLDIKNFDNNHPIGDRCFSDNVLKVCKYGISYMKGLEENNVIPVLKHFPGHGATNTDSHKFLPVISDFKIVGKKHLRPFKEAINNGADAIMVGHILVKGYTGFYPASLSKKFINKQLRRNLNYNKVIMTDELGMKSVSIFYGKYHSLLRAVKAGNDIICLKYYSGLEKDYFKLIKMVQNGKINIKRINDSVKRIIKLKEKYQLNDDWVSGCNVDEINKEIDDINKKRSSNN